RQSFVKNLRMESLEGRAMMAMLAPVSFPVGPSPVAVQVGDFNNDHKSDIIVANSGVTATLSVLTGNGDGTFQAPVTSASGGVANSLAVADFNGDGNVDVVTTNINASAVNFLMGN